MSKKMAEEILDIAMDRKGDNLGRLNRIRERCTAEIGKKNGDGNKKGVLKTIKHSVTGNGD